MRRQNVPHVVTVAALWLAFTFALIIALTAAAASDSFGHGRFYYAPSALSSGRARTSRAPFVATAHAVCRQSVFVYFPEVLTKIRSR